MAPDIDDATVIIRSCKLQKIMIVTQRCCVAVKPEIRRLGWMIRQASCKRLSYTMMRLELLKWFSPRLARRHWNFWRSASHTNSAGSEDSIVPQIMEDFFAAYLPTLSDIVIIIRVPNTNSISNYSMVRWPQDTRSDLLYVCSGKRLTKPWWDETSALVFSWPGLQPSYRPSVTKSAQPQQRQVTTRDRVYSRSSRPITATSWSCRLLAWCSDELSPQAHNLLRPSLNPLLHL